MTHVRRRLIAVVSRVLWKFQTQLPVVIIR